MSAIFISHSSKDDAIAGEIKENLLEQGHRSVFLDFDPEDGIPAGRNWEKELYARLRGCQAVIVLCTEHSMASPWCFAEITLARSLGKHLFPLNIAACQIPPLLGDVQVTDLTVNPAEGYQRLWSGLKKVGLDPMDLFDWDGTRPPYPGLLAFQEQDAAVYFGRHAAIQGTMETLNRLQRLGGARLVLVLGASGSGKSSLVRAGVLPRLKRDKDRWLVLEPFRPLGRPFVELAMVLAGAFTAFGNARDWKSIRDALNPEADNAGWAHQLDLANDLRVAAGRREATVLLVVDQFEELLGRDTDQSSSLFLRLLKAVLNQPSSPFLAVATLRSDFLGAFQTHEAVQDLRYEPIHLPQMALADFAQVIEGPAKVAGVELEPGLTQAMVADTATDDALPLLAFTLRELWDRYHGDGRLTLEEYQNQLGGLQGSLARAAEAIFAERMLSADEELHLRKAFLSMVRVDEEGRYVRRPALWKELPEDVRGLLERFVQARLLVSRTEGAERILEVAHEALFRSWDRLVAWLNADREFLLWRQRLRGDIAEWERNKHDENTLLRGPVLAEAERWLAERPDDLNEAEREFIRASVALREQAARERLRQRNRIIASVVIGIVLIAALFAWRWWEAKNANKKVGEVQQLARHTSDIGMKPQRSLLLSVRAASLSKDGRGGALVAIDGLRQQLRATGGRPLRGHEKSTRVAAFSLDRHWLATGSDDGAIRLWDLRNVDPTSRSFLLNGHNGRVHGLDFSPDGRWLVSGGADGAVRLWRLTEEGATPGPVFGGRYGVIHAVAISPKGDWLVFGTQSGNVCMWKMSAEGPLETPCEAWKEQDPVTNVVFSPRGRWLATTCAGVCPEYGAPVRLWDLSADLPTQEPRRLSHVTNLGSEDALLAIAFNADETRLAVAYGYFAEVWDLTKKDPPRHIVGSDKHTGWIRAVGLSPDNRWLATGSSEADVKLLDLTKTRKEPIILKGHTAAVNSVVFSDDGRWLATGGDDAIARLWDLADPTIPSTLLRGQDLPVKKVIFSPGPEPRHLVTVGDELRARLWNIPDPLADPIVLRGKVKPLIIGMAVSADGTWIATSSHEDPKLVLWSTKDPRQPARELPLPGASHAIAFSPDGRWLAAKSHDKGVISLWNFADLSKPPLELFEHEWGDVRSLGFSPDGRWLVSGTWKGIVNMWEVSSDNPSLEPRFRCQQDPVHGPPAFSSDGRYVATSAHGVTARLWDLTSPNPGDSPRVLGPHGDVVYVVTLSPDSRWAATASMDGKGRLWDLRAGSEPKLMSELAFKDRVVQATFSPDDRWVAFGSWDGTLKLLDLKNSAASKPTELAGHAGRILSASFSPDGRWLVTGSEDRTTRLWDPTDPSAAPVVLRGHEAGVAHVGFSKDSRWVITGAYDGTVRLWRLKLTDLVGIACQTAGRDLTPEEAKAFLGEEHAQPCTDQYTVEQSRPK